MVRFESQMSIASGVKGGNDDLRQDAIMEQVFAQVSELLKMNRATRQRNLSIRTYKVLPLTSIAGVIEFVPSTIPLHEYLMPAHERFYPKDLKGGKTSTTPMNGFTKRLAYTRSTAAISILGHVLGLGDRHGHNILLDFESGEVVHIDLGVAFEMGRVLPVPELVPFRLTRDIVDGMGITKTEGVSEDAVAQSVAPEPGMGHERVAGKQAVNQPSEADKALTVVKKKLSKTLSVEATVNDLINQASDETNLAALYSGWAAYA
ncbi:hypothetical protein DID88_007295 [Monilinia fructigena]|uniref:Serine/threonine-protein kinase TEL1 n=1 Tax=Monilinia fructigena TaxID=38457 RepID=A0A395JAA4_9HELO|nr:hypothetical protein DID88_007295 [Monilinia fructigena]